MFTETTVLQFEVAILPREGSYVKRRGCLWPTYGCESLIVVSLRGVKDEPPLSLNQIK